MKLILDVFAVVGCLVCTASVLYAQFKLVTVVLDTVDRRYPRLFNWLFRQFPPTGDRT